ILDKNRKEIKRFATDTKEKSAKFDITDGMNQFNWDLKYPETEKIEGMILWNGTPGGIIAPPGNYYAVFKVNTDSVEVPFTVKPDPNYKETQQEYDEQFKFLSDVENKFNEVQKAIKDIRTLRSQINNFVSVQGKNIPKEVKKLADSINKQLSSIEDSLYQTKAKSSQDVLNYPIRLNDKLSGVFDVANSGNFAPGNQVKMVYADLAAQADVQLNKLKGLREKEIPAFNELVRQKTLPIIGIQ
ncbi:MAG TPA: hypothetical protein VFQ58_06265, partial [Flavisolibacter sp.]|nr:hypothetical protein [Flavisolibacter sp.]